MISRREVVTAGVLGTLATTGTAEAAQSSQADAQALREGLKELGDKLNELKLTVEQGLRGNSMNYGNLAVVKGRIEQYAKTSGKFPDYCDIGLGVFTDVYDWHVRNQQQIQIVRVSERMAIQLMFTQLILRWENDLNYVGTPFDR
jgi:hypothetical protein